MSDPPPRRYSNIPKKCSRLEPLAVRMPQNKYSRLGPRKGEKTDEKPRAEVRGRILRKSGDGGGGKTAPNREERSVATKTDGVDRRG